MEAGREKEEEEKKIQGITQLISHRSQSHRTARMPYSFQKLSPSPPDNSISTEVVFLLANVKQSRTTCRF